ncbi:MAG: D-2-hydroxyacid dehydrogenase family protein [Candidatus Eremiobacteraeota bacterium]|nr:D-2-hydroxyacid dehydrogenase family protein [Candidatus Eremiobacteraeota bacterium]MBV8355768.1 D-2-hydroxyacid dehydrogenase family protein [Candidatus Eremiobacteraeota bacterium]
MRVAVLDDYQKVAQGLADWDSLGANVSVEFFHDHLEDEDRLVDRLRPFEVLALMRERTPVTGGLIARLPNLRLLVTSGKRNASIDVRAAQAHGATVCGTGIRDGSTVELAWALILAVARGLPQEERALREGRWQVALGHELRDKTLAILGLGRLGSQVAKIGQAFGMRTIAWSQNLTAERCAEVGGVELVDRSGLFERADVLTIHLVLSKRTRGLVGAGDLALMKPTAFLINTSRGPIVDESALIEALNAATIAGAGIDVYDREPLPADHPLRNTPNAVLSPHIGYVTEEVYRVFYPEMVEDIAAWLSGRPIRVIEP